MSSDMTFDPTSLIAPPVRNLAPYVPGKPLDELEREYGIRDSIKLASNENPFGPGRLAREAIAAVSADIGLYPDGNGYALKRALAEKHACAIESITLGNGSNDVLVMLAEAFLTPAAEAVYSQYAFAVYPIAVQASGAQACVAPALAPDGDMPLGHDLAAMAALVSDRTRLVFIANPNNPTGTFLRAKPLQAFIEAMPTTTLVIVDEAYIEYVDDPEFPDTSKWLADFPNLVVTRTFSKAYGLAGLRVGYALSDPGVADALNRVRQAFNVNTLALAAARAALADQEHVARSVAANREGLAQITAGFERLALRFLPTQGNFVLVDCGRPALAIYESMLRLGVIVRPVGNYGLPNHVRITVGTGPQNQRMLAALEQALAQR
jgi:histidinol-phosphate aminotransferase